MLLTVQDGVLGLSGTIEFGDRESPRLYELTLGGFARMFRLNPNVAWDRVSGALEDGMFCIRIPKGAESRPNSKIDEKRRQPRQYANRMCTSPMMK
jgi:hypothetical protein